MNNYRVLLFFVLLFSIKGFTQGIPVIEMNKNIKIVIEDTIVLSAVKRQVPKKMKLDATKRYYWYSKGMIKSNVGNFHGNLLDGKYEVLVTNHLIISGNFKNGLKDGLWNLWSKAGSYLEINNWDKGLKVGREEVYFKEGHLKEVFHYKKGVKNGNYAKYNNLGDLIEEGRLKKGKRKGRVKIYLNGEKQIERYRNGELIIAKPKVKKLKKDKKIKVDKKVKEDRKEKSKRLNLFSPKNQKKDKAEKKDRPRFWEKLKLKRTKKSTEQ